MSITAMRQALEALEQDNPLGRSATITALRTAIEQAEKQEPVACQYALDIGMTEYRCVGKCQYAAPPQREKQEPTGPLVNIELSRRMAAVKVNNFYGSIIKDAEKEIERLHGLVLQHAAPPQRTWVGLTDEEILSDDTLRYYYGMNGGAGPVSQKGKKVVAAIEAKLKEKNT